MVASFIHEIQPQRVVFAAGAIERLGDEAARLGLHRALVIATPGSGARLGQQLVDILGSRAAGLHAQAVVHVPKAVAEAGLRMPPKSTFFYPKLLTGLVIHPIVPDELVEI